MLLISGDDDPPPPPPPSPELLLVLTAPPPPPKPGETRVIVFGETVDDVADIADGAAGCCDALEDVPTREEPFVSLPEMESMTYARVCGPKYPVAGRPCAAWYRTRA